MISGLDTSVEYEFATFAKNYYGNSKWSEYNSTFPGADVITRTYDNDIDNDIDDDIIGDDDCKSMIMIFFYENYVYFFYSAKTSCEKLQLQGLRWLQCFQFQGNFLFQGSFVVKRKF